MRPTGDIPGRKSCPQWLMQWASSMAKRLHVDLRTIAKLASSSAVRAKRRATAPLPCAHPSRRQTLVAGEGAVECTAGTPHACSPSTWSFISAMSGEITTVVPPRARPGPGSTAICRRRWEALKVNRGCPRRRIASSWSGRKLEKPQCFWTSFLRSSIMAAPSQSIDSHGRSLFFSRRKGTREWSPVAKRDLPDPSAW